VNTIIDKVATTTAVGTTGTTLVQAEAVYHSALVVPVMMGLTGADMIQIAGGLYILAKLPVAIFDAYKLFRSSPDAVED
jgi:hypothetical protein